VKEDWTGTPDPLSALSQGDPEPFERFVKLETPTFLGFFRRLGARGDDAEDLTQDLFLRLVRHRERYRAGDRFEAYCFRVARNAWVDFERRRAVRPKPVDPEGEGAAEPGTSTSSDTWPTIADEARRLLDGLALLPSAQREVFELAVVQERPYAEVGELLGIPVGTVKSRMFHAARKLREYVEAATRERETTQEVRP
jgi:RNA polymerase sigma-70 factor (ECF subfamily)